MPRAKNGSRERAQSRQSRQPPKTQEVICKFDLDLTGREDARQPKEVCAFDRLVRSWTAESAHSQVLVGE